MIRTDNGQWAARNGDPLADVFVGTGADETYVVDSVDDVVIEAPGGGIDRVLTTLSTYALPDNVENLAFIGTGDFTGDGNDLDNVIIGGAGDDILSGGLGRDTLLGQGGNDTLDGGTGLANQMQGGLGDDTYVVHVAGDTVYELAGQGTDLVRTDVALLNLSANVENLTYIGAGAFVGAGNAMDNVITGGLAHDTLIGRDGNDTLIGGAGAANELLGGLGDDLYVVSVVGDTIVENIGEGTDTVQTAIAAYILRANVENLVFTGSGAFTGTGNASANAITGGAGNDTLNGMAGADVMTGLGGDDSYVVDDAGDQVVEGADAGADTVRTSLNSLTLFANVENLIFTGVGTFAGTGNELNNRIVGGAGADNINGGSGDDVLAGGAGADTLIGGQGFDTVDYSSAFADLIIHLSGTGGGTVQDGTGSTDTLSGFEGIIGGLGNDSLVGSNANDVLQGGAGADTLSGGAGDDVLIGGSGVDGFAGGTGNDTFYLDGQNESVVEANNAAGGVDTVYQSDVAYVMAIGIENLIYNGSGVFTGTGNSGDNTITGGAGADTLRGMDGNDILVGGGGVDQLDGGAGSDQVSFANATAGVTVNLLLNSAVDGDSIADVLTSIEGATGSAFADTLIGGPAAGIFDGGAGDDTITGGDLNDRLVGGLGADVMTGGLGDDSYVVDDLGDTVTELASQGTDSVETSLTTFTLGANFENLTYTGAAAFTGTGSAANNLIVGGGAADILSGLDGADTLSGGAGNDTLNGGEGDDVLVGGQGVDTMNGGGGIDTVDYSGQIDRNASVRVNLAGNVTQGDGQGAFDNLSSIENVIGGLGADTLIGDGGANVLIGSDGNDVLVGQGGDDFLRGGNGADAMQGGLGNDTYYSPDSNDNLIEFAGEGVDTIVSAENSYSMVENNIENLAFVSLDFAKSGFGNSLNNQITGGNAADSLFGNDGDDVLIGLDGNDFLRGGHGNDTLNGGVGADDRASVAGVMTDYSVVRHGDGTVTVTDLASGVDGDDGIDTLVGVETLVFKNGVTLDLSTIPVSAPSQDAGGKAGAAQTVPSLQDDAFVLPAAPDDLGPLVGKHLDDALVLPEQVDHRALLLSLQSELTVMDPTHGLMKLDGSQLDGGDPQHHWFW